MQIIYYLIAWSILTLSYIMIYTFIFMNTEYAETGIYVILIPLTLTSLILIPVILISSFKLIKLSKLTKDFELYSVEFKTIESYLHGYYFSFQIVLSNGEKQSLKTNPYFRSYGVRNYQHYLNKVVTIAHHPHYEYAIVMDIFKP